MLNGLKKTQIRFAKTDFAGTENVIDGLQRGDLTPSALLLQNPWARYLSSAFIALIILVASVLDADVSLTEKLIVRVALVALATLYVVAALSAVNRFLASRG